MSLNVVDLHPEDLLDRDARGELSPADTERLEKHLAKCGACRLERLARMDFQNEHDPDKGDFDVNRLLSEVLAPGTDREALRPHLPAPVRRARRRRAHPFLLVAAALFVAGASAAAGWNGLRAFQQQMLGPSTSDSAVSSVVQSARRATAQHALTPTPTLETAPMTPVAMTGVAPSEPPQAPAPPALPSRPTLETRASAIQTVVAPVVATQNRVAPAMDAPPTVSDAALLFERANRARRTANHGRAEELYRTLIERYPSSSEAHESQALLGHALLDGGDTNAALHCFDEYLRGGGSLAEDVMADRAIVLGRLGRSSDEGVAWEALLRAYPSSVHAERAQGRLRELRGL